MPSFDAPMFSSSNGFVSVELHDKDQLGAYVLIHFPDPNGPRVSGSEDRQRVVEGAKEYIAAVLEALS